MVDLDEHLGKYLSMLVQSYNPDTYVTLVEHSWRRFATFFFATLSLAFLIFTLVFIPATLRYIDALPQTLEQVQEFTISGSIEADHPITILQSPSVMLDLNATEERSDYDVLFTREGVRYPSFLFFGHSFVHWADVRDLKNPTPERDRLLFGFALFLLPSIIFWFALLTLIKLLGIVALLILLGYALPRAFSHRISWRETVKVAILSMPSVMLIGMGLSPLAPGKLIWWGLGITVVLFALGVFMLSERAHAARRSKV
jgi:hypothetical protein